MKRASTLTHTLGSIAKSDLVKLDLLDDNVLNFKVFQTINKVMSFRSNSPINLSEDRVGIDVGSIKTESGDEMNGHTAIKRHTIDAILGLPRLGGFHPDLGLDVAEKLNRSAYSESEEKDKLDVDGKTLLTTLHLLIINLSVRFMFLSNI